MMSIERREIHAPLHAIYSEDGMLVAAFPTADGANAYRALIDAARAADVLFAELTGRVRKAHEKPHECEHECPTDWDGPCPHLCDNTPCPIDTAGRS